MPLSIQNRTRASVPKIRFDKLKEEILGEKYELSLVFVDKKLSQQLNSLYRGKDSPTDILSFPLEKQSGEIFIDLATSQKEMQKFAMDKKTFVTFLFIHGCLHLKGMQHGDRMERLEKHYLNVASNRSWY